MRIESAAVRVAGWILAIAALLGRLPMCSAQQQTLILDNGFAVGPGILRVLPRLDKKGYAGSNETQAAARIAGLDDGLG